MRWESEIIRGARHTKLNKVVLGFRQDGAANAYNWVVGEDRKHWKVNNNLDGQVSLFLACVTFPCVFEKLTIH